MLSLFLNIYKKFVRIIDKEFDLSTKLIFVFDIIINIIKVLILTYIPLFLIFIVNRKFSVSYIFGILGIEGFVLIIHLLLQNYQNVKYLTIRNRKLQEFQKIFQNVDYYLIENEQFQNEVQKAFNAVSSNMGIDLFLKSVSKCMYLFFVIIVYSIVIFHYNTLILFLVILSFCFLVILNLKHNRQREILETDKMELERRKNYFDKLCIDVKCGKDVRNNKDIKTVLNSYYKSVNNQFFYKISRRIKSDILFINFVSVINYTRDIIGIIILINLYYLKTISLETLPFLLTVYFLISIQLQNFFEELLKVHSSFILVENFYKFLDKYKIKKSISKNIVEIERIEFIDVWFKYPNNNLFTLKNINLTINKFDKVGFVGVNGAGKSTIIKLICGLYKPTKGKILINDIDINLIDKHEYYSLVSAMFQDNTVYATTVYGNIVGKENYKFIDERLKNIVKSIGIEKEIDSFKNKFSQQIRKELEDDGIELSGGLIQKVCCVRTLSKICDVYIFDEPTSALDVNSENQLINSFFEFTRNKIVIYISHKMHELNKLDKVFFLKDRTIHCEGTHNFLLHNCSEYFELYKLQKERYR